MSECALAISLRWFITKPDVHSDIIFSVVSTHSQYTFISVFATQKCASMVLSEFIFV